MRIGGEHALADAKAGKDGGFKNATFVEAGERLRELAALEPFQPGALQTSHAQSAGIFGDGKAARMDLMGPMGARHAGPSSTSGKGLAPGGHRHLFVSDRSRRQEARRPTCSAASIPFLVTKDGAAKETVDFLNFFSQEKYAQEAAATGGYIPVYSGR